MVLNVRQITLTDSTDIDWTPVRLQFDHATTILRYGLPFWASALQPEYINK